MQLGAKQQQSKAIYPLSPLPQVVFFSSCLPSTRKRIAQGIASRPPGADPAKDMRVHMYTRHFFKKMELVGKIHGQIRKQSVYVRLLELDSAQQEGKGMGAHTSLSDARRRGSAGRRTAQGIVAARKGRPRERVRGREREGVERRSEHK